jgi:hypothetical protein
LDAVLFGGQATVGGEIPPQFSPLTFEEDGHKSQVAIVQDSEGKDHLVVHSEQPNSKSVNVVLGGVPTRATLQTGYTTFFIEPDEAGGYGITTGHSDTPPPNSAGLTIENTNTDVIHLSTLTTSSLPPQGETLNCVEVKSAFGSIIPVVSLKSNDDWLIHATPQP